ncbi:cysteine rich repeat-containing protein [Kaistia terrae]|uniref:Cysteine rich repeat-containing protein n=1 Tax=Kaistia terrae TaxID=537017 RepID=A0ABW0Q3B4_9HYPH|nr:cysteine rich repeat-containing protein [Kaistia terrae]MCX5581732.1 cysteine rich repeat-containing protein [Kaistia terrae]
MRSTKISLAAILTMAFLAPSTAQTISYSEAGALLAKSCGKDIEKYCPKVNLGGGALKDCLMERAAQISPQCIADYKTVVASLNARLAAQAAVTKACQGDATQFCQGTAPGNAHYLNCLNAAKKVVSKRCTTAITNAGWN